MVKKTHRVGQAAGRKRLPVARDENVLLAVLGTTPSVLTETWYAIATQRKSEPFIPDRVVVVTSGKGRDLLREQLFDTHRVARLCQANGLPMAFSLDDVYVPCDENGREYEDVRNSREFTAFANTVLKVVRELTEEERKPRCRIHASIAGGRKTMGYYLGQSMNIFGRPGDVISHIIVKTGYETDDFFYPGQVEAMRNGLPVDDPDIIEMTEFPVVSLAAGINIARFKSRDMQFEDILRAIAEEQAGIVLPMQFMARRGDAWVSFGATRLDFEPAQVMALVWLAWRACANRGDAAFKRDGSHYSENYIKALRLFFLEYQCVKAWCERLPGEKPKELITALMKESAEDSWKDAPADIEQFFRPRLSRCQKKLEETLSRHYSVRPEEGVYRAPAVFLKDETFRELNVFMTMALKALG